MPKRTAITPADALAVLQVFADRMSSAEQRHKADKELKAARMGYEATANLLAGMVLGELPEVIQPGRQPA